MITIDQAPSKDSNLDVLTIKGLGGFASRDLCHLNPGLVYHPGAVGKHGHHTIEVHPDNAERVISEIKAAA